MKGDLCPEDQLELLRQNHRKLDLQIRKQELRPLLFNHLKITDLKRQKLRLKERIKRLEQNIKLLQK